MRESHATPAPICLCWSDGKSLHGLCPFCGSRIAGHGIGDGPRCSSCPNCSHGEYLAVQVPKHTIHVALLHGYVPDAGHRHHGGLFSSRRQAGESGIDRARRELATVEESERRAYLEKKLAEEQKKARIKARREARNRQGEQARDELRKQDWEGAQ